MGAAYWLRRTLRVSIYSQSIYIVVPGARRVCVILKILLHISRNR